MEEQTVKTSYTPLFIIVSLIFLVTTIVTVRNSGSFFVGMQTFMAGFFLVFSGFKLLDIRGFAQGYSKYDLVAKQWYGYGYCYPFIELLIGIAYLANLTSPFLHISTFLLMTISGIGVLQRLLQKRKIECACLGTFLRVPLTKVTVVEDFSMAIMALLMLFVA